MLSWSCSVLNSEPASDVIRLEESGTLRLDNSVNQLSNVIDPAMWNMSCEHQCLCRIGMKMDAAMAIYYRVQRIPPVTWDYN